MDENTVLDNQETLGSMIEHLGSQVDRLYIKLGYLEKLMTVIANGGRVHQAGGYAYGRTSTGDPFILLYAPHNSMVHKLCRVYPEDFDKLPHFIPTINLPPNASELNLTKTELKKRGHYHNCPSFKFATVEGKDTQMGPEVRFYDTMFVEREVEIQVEDTPTSYKLPPVTSVIVPEREKVAPTQLPGTTDEKGQTLEEFNQGIIQAEAQVTFKDGTSVPAQAMPYYDQYKLFKEAVPQNLQALRDWYKNSGGIVE